MQDRGIDNRTTDLNRRNTGMGSGTIAAIIVVLLIAGSLYIWRPWADTNNAALNSGPATTTGQTSTAPAVTPPAAPTATTPAAPASPANPAPTTR